MPHRGGIPRHERAAQMRRIAIEYLGGMCSSCGSRKDLHFRYFDPMRRQYDIERRLGTSEWPVLKQEVRKCTLRCKECGPSGLPLTEEELLEELAHRR